LFYAQKEGKTPQRRAVEAIANAPSAFQPDARLVSLRMVRTIEESDSAGHTPLTPFSRVDHLVGFYRQFVVPRLIDFAMRNKDATRFRSRVVPQARGEVLEIGIGSGFNLPFYSDNVTRIRAVDPSRKLLQMAEKKARSLRIPVDLLNTSAEELPVENQAVDTVVMTWVLCSIPKPEAALSEMLRVLKPGGDLLFVEHGRSSETKVRAWQDRINRPWRAFTGGCNLNREVDRLISEAGFRILQMNTSYLPGPKPFTFTYCGSARK
jgi:ubiquinone/menaquinone biosynthesis C-methylase UbiE